jgi:hypothetical protein
VADASYEIIRASKIQDQPKQKNSDQPFGFSVAAVARKISTTLGWRPACTCPEHDPVPCVVLDPFSGAGTTVMVARELGRHGIGLELSGEYLQQSRERLGLAALDAWAGGNGNGKATSLGDLPMFRDRQETET